MQLEHIKLKQELRTCHHRTKFKYSLY
uniref:Uncharacterized protein n=1 Tax=Rhizophora mucronata TaxID=61149 RepID=A0A2P2Q1P1_RHIMU